MLKSTHLYVLTILAVTTAACDRQPTPAEPGDHRAAAAAESEVENPFLVPHLRETARGLWALNTPSARISGLLPAFGGAFIDGRGVLNVYLAGQVPEADARNAVATVLRQIRRENLSVEFLPGRYSFTQLNNWHTTLVTVFRASGVVFSEVGERENRIKIGVTNSEASQAVEQALPRLGVPREAIQFVAASPPIELASVEDRIRPLRGGTEIRTLMQGRDRRKACTYGVNVLYQNRRHMVMNSHCTWTDDGTKKAGWVGARIFQDSVPTYTSEANYYEVGVEVQDPPFSTSLNGCPPELTEGCRYSDAVLVELEDFNTNSYTTWDVGGVARPIGPPAVLPDSVGPKTVDSNNPTFRIKYVSSDILLGDIVDKVGRTTGWTQGRVESTCRNVYYPSYGYLCAGVVSAGSGGGDSGAPVLWRTAGGEYHLFGLLFGKSTEQTEYYFNKWSDIDYELGGFSRDLYPEDTTNSGGGGGGGGGDCTTDPTLPC